MAVKHITQKDWDEHFKKIEETIKNSKNHKMIIIDSVPTIQRDEAADCDAADALGYATGHLTSSPVKDKIHLPVGPKGPILQFSDLKGLPTLKRQAMSRQHRITMPETAKETTCNHIPINVGFQFTKMVCAKCDKDLPNE